MKTELNNASLPGYRTLRNVATFVEVRLRYVSVAARRLRQIVLIYAAEKNTGNIILKNQGLLSKTISSKLSGILSALHNFFYKSA